MLTLRELIEVLQQFPNQDARVSFSTTKYGGVSIAAHTDEAYHLLYLDEPTEEGTRRYLYNPERDFDENLDEKWWP